MLDGKMIEAALQQNAKHGRENVADYLHKRIYDLDAVAAHLVAIINESRVTRLHIQGFEPGVRPGKVLSRSEALEAVVTGAPCVMMLDGGEPEECVIAGVTLPYAGKDGPFMASVFTRAMMINVDHRKIHALGNEETS